MSIVAKPYTITAGDALEASPVDDNFDTIFDLVNGDLDNDNVTAAAAIEESKLLFDDSTGHGHTGTGNDGTKIDADYVVFDAAGDIVATDVQAAIEELDTEKLALAGGTMSGAIAMGTNKITGMGDPTEAQDAATRAYVLTSPNIATGTYTGNGGTDREIDIGFQPQCVMVWGVNAGSINELSFAVRSSSDTTDSSAHQSGTGAWAYDTNAIRDFTANGFNVGATTGNYANKNSVVYMYVAFR